MYLDKEATYFAAANTTRGFQSHFTEIFNPDQLDRIYIIKGGPGTGKSSLMRRIAAAAEKKGIQAERILCSSDPDSLDGIILPDLKTAMLDGTSPHTVDPAYPGVVETILNTGAFWDMDKLLKNKAEILSKISNGKRLYNRAYRFLSAMGEICQEMQQNAEKALQKEKINDQINRIAKKVFTKDGSGNVTVRVLSTFNRNGFTTLPSFTGEASEIYYLRDRSYTVYFFLDQLMKKALENRQNFVYAPSCLFCDMPETLYFPGSGVLFKTGEIDYIKPDVKTHTIHMDRFIDKSALRENLKKMRFGKKCADTLLKGATDAFRDASLAHDQLEKYYIASMDFMGLNDMIVKLEQEIF